MNDARLPKGYVLKGKIIDGSLQAPLDSGFVATEANVSDGSAQRTPFHRSTRTPRMRGSISRDAASCRVSSTDTPTSPSAKRVRRRSWRSIRRSSFAR